MLPRRRSGRRTRVVAYDRPQEGSTQMVDLLKTVNRRGNAFHSCLQLKRQKLGVVACLGQVPPLETKPLLLGRLPHSSPRALPGAPVLGRIRTPSPHLAPALAAPLPERGPARALPR